MTTARLTVIATEAGANVCDSERYQWNMRADLADIRLWRFYHAAPDEFFSQYAAPCIIDHVHLAREVLSGAADFLRRHPDRRLILAGPLSVPERKALAAQCRDFELSLAVVAINAPRALRFEGGCFHASRPLPQAIKQAGIAEPTHSPALHWAQWYRRFTVEEVVAELRVRDPGVFFAYLKTLAQATATPVNWQSVADAAGVSAPTAKLWGRFLERIGLIDLVPPVGAPPPRRTLTRSKLYWTSPGLALWLTDAMMHVGAFDRLKYVENAVYLALKDAFPSGEFGHFMDTNKVCAPLLVREFPRDDWRMYALCDTTSDLERLVKHHKSLCRLRLVRDALHLVRLGTETEPIQDVHDAVWHRLSISP